MVNQPAAGAAGKPAAPATVKRSSAQKEAVVALRRNKRNRSAVSQVKTDITTAEKLIFSGDIAAAEKAVTAAVSALDKAAGKKVVHANNAARRKSRLLKKLVQARKQPQAAKPEK
ncbi:MAG TPA: 30S ribosomal protein S20 [Dehalococcoidales bacterium]|nr:30S ribosomal protein S20 [Dehalococcoidales bacterium]